ncbi:MAG TPA: hypothetical protein VFR24_10840 [Candidatus Angelobacter sp.]|nr:hypothetical protein [Candidatus Angelobacter sp.]
MYCSTVCGAVLPLRAVLLLGDAFLRPAERDVAFFISAEVFNARAGCLAGFAFFIPRWYRKRSATGKEQQASMRDEDARVVSINI